MTEEQLKDQLDKQFADFFGKVTKHFDARFDELDGRLTMRIDRMQNTADGIAKQLDTFQQEQTIINARTEQRLDQLSESTNVKWATN